MTTPIDLITKRRLHLVKQLYQQAFIRLGASQDLTSMIMSVIGLDLSVETVLKVAISWFEPSDKDERTFPNLIKQCNALLTRAGLDTVPDRRNILHVHDIRNDAQHRGKYPTETEVSDCRTYVRDFLGKLTDLVWGVPFEKITLVDAIENSKHRDLLSQAEESLALGEIGRAVNFASVALNRVLGNARKALSGDAVNQVQAVLVLDRFNTQRASKPVAKTLSHMQQTLLMLALGIDPVSHARFWTLTLTEQRKKNCTPAEADFVVTYCIETALQVEARVKGLQAISYFTRG